MGADAALQFANNFRKYNFDVQKSLLCINVSTLPASFITGAAGTGNLSLFWNAEFLRRTGQRTLYNRLAFKVIILSETFRQLVPPITIGDIINQTPDSCGCR